MWFDDDDVHGKRRVNRGVLRESPILKVNARIRDQQRARVQLVAVALLIPLVAVLTGYIGWLGIKRASGFFFAGNRQYTINKLVISNGGVVVQDFIKGKKNIREGTNLFAFDIAAVCREFLAVAHGFKAIEVVRRLPDTVEVSVVERIPLARIGRNGVLVTDDEGRVFAPRTALRTLPALVNCRESKTLQPGNRLSGMATAAIQLLQVCDDPELGLPVESVDVGSEESLLVRVRQDGQIKDVRLAWRGMTRATPESRKDLLKKLGQLSQALQTEPGKRLSKLDGTYSDSIYGE
jgi:hypothetical protein